MTMSAEDAAAGFERLVDAFRSATLSRDDPFIRSIVADLHAYGSSRVGPMHDGVSTLQAFVEACVDRVQLFHAGWHCGLLIAAMGFAARMVPYLVTDDPDTVRCECAVLR